jgi:hypothetical protein
LQVVDALDCEVVSRIFASWNQLDEPVDGWLRQVEAQRVRRREPAWLLYRLP